MLTSRRNTILTAVVVLVTCTISIVAVSRGLKLSKGSSSTRAQDKLSNAKPTAGHRNLLFQPEAATMARRLGKRFVEGNDKTSLNEAVVTTDGQKRSLGVVRQQTTDGESVEIRVASVSKTFSWNREQGARVSGERAKGSDQELIDRLTYDSVDQFVLAQLRGSSYQVIARNVRPNDVGDDYPGPTWTVVRVSEPPVENNGQVEWRLYYLNTMSGLIDRIESETQGQRIVAEILEWTEVNGETLPRQIVWKSGGRTLMEYTLTNFSNSSK